MKSRLACKLKNCGLSATKSFIIACFLCSKSVEVRVSLVYAILKILVCSMTSLLQSFDLSAAFFPRAPVPIVQALH